MSTKSHTRLCRFAALIVVAAVTATAIAGPSSAKAKQAKQGRAKNVILFIGDGMGPAQVEASAFKAFGQKRDEKGNPMKLSFEQFPVMGYLTTFAANSFVSDSAAAGSALACGKKTDNGMISVLPDGKPMRSISEIARAKGRAVGVLSSVALNDATPSCFYAHCGSRGNQDAITSQIFDAPVADVLMGGGIVRKTWTDDKIRTEAEKAGIKFFTCGNFSQITSASTGDAKVLGYFDANDNKQLEFETSRTAGSNEPSLVQMTAVALDLLKRNPKGFFLMAESGSIDWACHRNNAPQAIGEALELDRTVAQTLEFLAREKILDSTLVIVTADHETGGMTIPGPYKKILSAGDMPDVQFSTKGHTGMPVFVWARGPGSELLRGKNDNTAVFDAMAAALE